MTIYISKYTYGHSSKSKDLTLDKCVPKFLWIPEHSIQIKVPKLRLAQSGSEKKDKYIHIKVPKLRLA